MQNFPNSPAPPPPGFPSRSGGMVGSPYAPHMSDPQMSPRTSDDYAAMQQPQPIQQTHGQHLHLRGQQHSGQVSHIHGYGSRRGAGDTPQVSAHIGNSNNSYRKENMDYYFSLSGRDRNRRGGGYGAGFGYSNMDAHIPHQYRHVSVPGSSSGMMSPYPVDYSTSAASGSGGNGGGGSFSPSQQYSLSQNSSMQSASGAEMLQRQHSQKYTAHQTLHQGHRAYSLSGHRIPSQFGHYPLGASTVPANMYNSPPQRYETGSSGSIDSKINSPTHSNSNPMPASAASHNSGHQEHVGQSYSSSAPPPYSPQSQPVHKHASRRNPQQHPGTGYDASPKMQHAPPSHTHTKNSQSSVSSSPAGPHHPSQDISKSPMHSQNQPSHMNQNFSPISNPSPAPSAVHSPSCSSSSSPLMGTSEGLGNTLPPSLQPVSHPSLLNPRSGQSHVRLPPTMPQLSPTPSSNSSISSCGSNVGIKAAGLNPSVMGSSMTPNRMGPRGGPRDEGSSSLYPQDKLSQDTGLNSLNALTSQVANLPNTVQHMLLTDTVLSQKKGRDGAYQPHSQQPAANLQKCRNPSSAGHATANEESGDMKGSELEEEKKDHGDSLETEKVKQKAGPEPRPASNYPASKCQKRPQIHPGFHLQMDCRVTEASVKSVSQNKPPSAQTPSSSSSSSPPSVPPFAEQSPSAPSGPLAPSPSTSSPAPSVQSNCVAEPDLASTDDKSALKDKTQPTMKDERPTEPKPHKEHHHQEVLDKAKNVKLVSIKVEHSGANKQTKKEDDDKKSSTQQFPNKTLTAAEQSNAGAVGVIVSARSEQTSDENKETEATSHYGASCHLGKLSYSEEKHSINMFKESGSHNGDRDMESFTAQYEVSPKTEFPQSMSSNHCHPASYKYTSSEVQYSACMGAKNKGRIEPGGGMSTNRYQDYHQSQSNFASVYRKDASVLGMVGRSNVGAGLRSQDSNSQLQQQFPSLLQEVLQGYHLDRRYVRPESTAHHQAQNLSQHHYHTRLPYRMMENMRPHGVAQSVMGSANIHHQINLAKPHAPNQGQGSDHEMRQGLLHPTWDSEAQRPKGDHGVSLEKGTTNMSPVHSAHVHQASDSSVGTPPKHINLADYSLPQRKPTSLATPPSAVQQLLLQETDSLAGNAEPLSQTQSQTSSSSGRRSVICDVSPSRRITPERERGQCGTSGPSVIQQTLSCSGLNEQGCAKEAAHDKRGQETKETSKVNPKDIALQTADGHGPELPKEDSSKSIPAHVDFSSDLHRKSVSKGDDVSKHHLSHNPLSSPARRKPYSLGLDGSSASFSAYGFGVELELPKMNTHHASHNPFHTLSSPSHIPTSANKLQAYPQPLSFQHPASIDDRFDWSANNNRPKDVPVHHSDQKLKIQSPTESFPSQHHLRQHSYPDSHYDMKMWESYTEREGAGNQQVHSAGPHEVDSSQPVPASAPKPDVDLSRGVMEESAKPFHSPAAASAVGSGGISGSSMTPGIHQGYRQSKTGSSAETNPLMMRRRVRSFISPIPAKRQHQDFSSHRSGASHHSPAPLSESRHLNDSESAGVDAHSKITSPTTSYQPSSANSPLQGKTKVLPPRKGRGLKLEEIVQKITPNKKNSYNNNHLDSDYTELSHYSSDIADPETGAPFSSAPLREAGCLPYLDDTHSLDDILPYRVEEAYSCDSQVLKQSAVGSSSGSIRHLPTDFDFGLGAAGSSGPGTGEDDKDDFTLLGPLPPPPPLPRPVQGSPPPSSSALSDIQQFTNTYQQLETRRGEQSAANLLRQKLQETGMGFDDYSGADFYSGTPPHNQSPGHHLLSRPPQHQLASGRMATSDSKSSENIVPKGYFPSGKKKGRPVGSVNKQKRAQVQVQGATTNITAGAHTPPATVSSTVPLQTAPDSISAGETVTTSTPSEQKASPSLEPPPQSQAAKLDVESEDNQPDVDTRPVKLKQKKGKEGNEISNSKGRQWRRRRELVSTEELDSQNGGGGGGNTGVSGILQDARKNAFSPYIHVERKIAEIGAVCTIVNSEDEKSKGGGKGNNSGVDVHSSASLTSQMIRKEREIEKTQEKIIPEQTDSAIQSGKSLPTSGYVLQGPVASETGHTGRFLCCLCQKWANYKNLGDLYGPFYPAEYAAKFPKNQPQVRQILSNSGTTSLGPNLSSVSTELNTTGTQLINPPLIKMTDSTSTVSQTTNPASPATTVSTVSPVAAEDLSCFSAKANSAITKTPAENWDPMPEVAPSMLKTPDLENERRQQKAEDLQQRPQHRKLTSHPRFKRRHKSSEDLPRTIPINSKASLPFQPPPPSVDSLGPLAQLAQLPLVPLDPNELWVHESCIVWTSGIYLVNGRLYGLQEALDGARETSCSHCEMAGATLGCYSKGCTLRYHYMCAIEADCCLNEDNFSLRCPKHKFPLNSRPAKSAAAYLEQSERG